MPEIPELLARLDEGQKHIIKKLEDQERRLEKAEEGRSRLHARIDDQVEDIQELKSLAQTQQHNLESLQSMLENHKKLVDPALIRWIEIATLGKYVSLLLVSVGVTGAGILLTAKAWVMSLLGIKP